MAGRGTDIRPPAAVLESGGLAVILTEFHESPRIDRQLVGRDGEPRRRALQALRAGGIVPRWLLKILVRRVQRKAERYNRRIRLDTLKQDRKLQTMLGFAGSKR